MSNPSCVICENARTSWDKEPCFSCKGHINWTPVKPQMTDGKKAMLIMGGWTPEGDTLKLGKMEQAQMENKYPWSQEILDALKAGHTVYVKNSSHDWQAVDSNMLGVSGLYTDMVNGQWRLHKPPCPLVFTSIIPMMDKSIYLQIPADYREKTIRITIEVVE